MSENNMPYINRELSWLDFNDRVLEECYDENHPILEKFKFLAISASNIDEFFMVRVAGLHEQIKVNYKGIDPAGLSSEAQLIAIHKKVNALVKKQYSCLYESLFLSLSKESINLMKMETLNADEKSFVQNYFNEIILPILTPMAIDKSRPFPLLSNKSLYLGLRLYDSKTKYKFALVQIPAILPRMIRISQKSANEKYILIEDIIKEYIHKLFIGTEILGKGMFRITKNSDLSIDEDESEDLLIEIKKSLKQRRFGDPVRLEIEHNTDVALEVFLVDQLNLKNNEIYKIYGMIDLTSWFAFYGHCNRPELKKKDDIPQLPQDFEAHEDIFETIRNKDCLIHHPYESFEHVLNFIDKAAVDPNVLAIKQTLYRVSGHSPIIQSLIQAAENGKQVTVLVELKARFEEEKNINWARTLEEAGCHVIYGLAGLKTHCKAVLIVRKEEDGIRRYVHLATGNYNDNTAKLYTDISFFTCKEKYASDISSLFNALTGYSQVTDFYKISTAPQTLRDDFIELIRNESFWGHKGRIIAKMNSLVDPTIIYELYSASQKGVKIDLIIRGICCLNSGIDGISENIRVISIIGNYLEHSRIFFFGNNGDSKILLSSADWMQRNLDRRVEILFPIEDIGLKKRVENILDLCLLDTVKARIQNTDGTYSRVDTANKPIINSQEQFWEDAYHNNKVPSVKILNMFSPFFKKHIK